MPVTAATATTTLPEDETLAGPALRSQVVGEAGDAAASTGTVYTIAVGDQFDGTISTTSDRDWVAINLVAGQSYVVQVWGRGGTTAGLDDPEVIVRGPGGVLITSNDDASSNNFFSLVQFTATTTGTYYIEVGDSPFATETGTYTLQVATNVFTPEQVATYIGEFNWGSPVPWSYAVDPGAGVITYNIQGLNAAGQQLAQWAFEMWSQTTGLLFSRVTTGGNIVLDDNSNGAFAGPSSYSPVTGQIFGSTVNVGTGWLNTYGTTIDSYSFLTYLHEIGHALGLGHAGEYDGSATYGISNEYLNDSYQMTIMSYFSVLDNTFVNGVDGLPITPMLADLIAIANNYGTLTAFGGNTVWGAGNNLGGLLGRIWSMLAGEVATDPAMFGNGSPIMGTINDTGGNDTLDLSFSTVAQRIDLRPGTFSDVDGFVNNIAISTYSIIENAVGGTGADRITGNDANNRITGGRGNDTVDGGAGSDTAVIAAARTSVTVTAIAGGVRITSVDGTDDYTNVEFFQFSDGTFTLAELTGGGGGGGGTPAPIDGGPGPDPLNGTAGDDVINGFAGADRIDAGTGNDTINGGADPDEILARAGDDSVLGGTGNDNIAASDGNDTVFGEDGDDSLGGGNGNDSLYGGIGRDVTGGGSGEDLLDMGDGDDTGSGGAGRDTVYGGAGNDQLAGSFDNDSVYGDAGNDDLGGGTGNDYLYGGIGDDSLGAGDDSDFLYGGDGNDFMGGGSGADQLFGGTGNDRLNGGAGNDTLYGEGGSDRFIFNALTAGEVDRIMDFADGTDRLQVHGVGFGQLTIQAVTGGVSITALGHQIIVEGVTVGQIDASDFIFI